jgi:hypothetical protein
MSDAATRYPLSWPAGWKRHIGRRTRAAFGRQVQSNVGSWTTRNKLTPAQAIDRLRLELTRLGARDVILSTNVPVRLDGWPRSDAREPQDPGAAVYFTLNKRDRCLACDRWDRVADNIAAIAAHVSALRGIDRWGVGTIDQAFTGYAALPAPATAAEWWRVLNLSSSATLDQVEDAFRRLALEHHPDRGGDHETMTKLLDARDAARKALGAGNDGRGGSL